MRKELLAMLVVAATIRSGGAGFQAHNEELTGPIGLGNFSRATWAYMLETEGRFKTTQPPTPPPYSYTDGNKLITFIPMNGQTLSVSTPLYRKCDL